MTFTLSPDAIRAGYRLSLHDTIDSTSAEAMRLAWAGEAGPLWVVAREQQAGVGRRGSGWQTPRGNLAASLLLTTNLAPATLATLGFVAGIALRDALDECHASSKGRLRPAPQSLAEDGLPHLRHAEEARHAPSRSTHDGGACFETARFAGLLSMTKGRDELIRSGSLEARTPFALKWPNDVLADGAKLAGILLGTEDVAPGRRAVVIGIGVNVAHAPSGLPYPAASLASLGVGADAAELFGALSAAWVRAYDIWSGPDGFSEIRKRWIARAAGLGGEVAVRTAAGVTRGIFETIDEHGQLVVRVADGSARNVSAGEVHFGVAASATPELRA